MISKGHKKHAYLEKPKGGKYGRNEFGIIGAPCDIIQKLSHEITEKLIPEYKVGYMDAAHQNDEPSLSYEVAYRDNIGQHALAFHHDHIDYGLRPVFNQTDLILVNGNHFLADRQIVIINEKKKASLERKLDRLSNIFMFILDEGISEIHPFLIDVIDDGNEIPILNIQEVDQIAQLINKEMTDQIPKLNGLILAGGKSVRMGHDKGEINYHGKPQREYMADLLSNFTKETFISVRDKNIGFKSEFKLIPDSFQDLGPFGGILSAFRKEPNRAWLTIATDIPLLDENVLKLLLSKRNPSKLATCFHNPETKFPEPLITIWEPRAYPVLLQFLATGYSCPRKVLINSEIEEVHLDQNELLTNINTPEELDAITSKING